MKLDQKAKRDFQAKMGSMDYQVTKDLLGAEVLQEREEMMDPQECPDPKVQW